MTTTNTHTNVNGIDLNILNETVQAIQADPGLGKCQFRARNTWMGDTHNCSTISGFYGAKQEIPHKHTFALHADEPPILAGNDDSANPVQHLLYALASCVTTSLVAHAAVQNIPIEELESELEGDIDIRGFLGLDPSVPKGYTNIRMNLRVKTDPDNLEKLRTLAAFSPVYNTLIQGAQVDIQVESK